jgi:hypothetical protein
MEFAGAPEGISGDYNFDGQVDEQDRAVWESSNGSWSLTEFLAADGNRDGIVDAADELVWRDGLARFIASQSAPVVDGPTETPPTPDPTPLPEPVAVAPQAGIRETVPTQIAESTDRPKSNDLSLKTATPLLSFGFAANGRLETRHQRSGRTRFDDFVARERSDVDSRVDYRRMQSTEIESAIGNFHEDEPANCSAVDEAFHALTRATTTLKRGRSADKGVVLPFFK